MKQETFTQAINDMDVGLIQEFIGKQEHLVQIKKQRTRWVITTVAAACLVLILAIPLIGLASRGSLPSYTSSQGGQTTWVSSGDASPSDADSPSVSGPSDDPSDDPSGGHVSQGGISGGTQSQEGSPSQGPDDPPQEPLQRVASLGLQYTLNRYGTAYTLTGMGTCTDSKVVVADRYKGLPVTAIGDNAFAGCDAVVSVDIPDSITEIGTDAFAGTAYYNDESNWEDGIFYAGSVLVEGRRFEGARVTVKEGTKVITYHAFLGNQGLEEVVLPSSLRQIYAAAFSGCDSLTTVCFPKGLEVISEQAFFGCSSLGSINLPEGLCEIGGGAFAECISLTEAVIPESVERIGDRAFAGCTSLSTVTLPSSLKELGKDAFVDTPFAENEENWEGGAIYVGGVLMEVRKDITVCLVKEGTVAIGKEAFMNCTSLEAVVLPEGLSEIGARAFSGCEKLCEIVVPEGVTEIGDGAFRGCVSLSTVTLPEGLRAVGEEAFLGCESLLSLRLPDSVTLLGSHAFSGCRSLAHITLPDGVAAVDKASFVDTAYYRDESNWEDGVLYIGGHLIACETRADTCVVKEGTLTVSRHAFEDNIHLTRVSLPNSVTEIGDYAFCRCGQLTEINVPGNLRIIGALAFAGDYNLKSITLPDTVEYVGQRAFEGCTKLEFVTLPEKDIGLGTGVFDNTDYYNEENNWEGDLLYIGCHLIGARNTVEEVVVKEGTKTVVGAAFAGCMRLTTLTLPRTVTYISADIVEYGSSLQTISYKGTVEEWNIINKGEAFANRLGGVTVVCTDGSFTYTQWE